MAAQSVTELLLSLRDGRRDAVNDLVPLVYRELRIIAARLAPAGGDATLSSTALVHEAYLRLVDQTQAVWQDRKHFFAVAAMAMRQIVVDHARRKLARKRGGDLRRVETDEVALPFAERTEDILALDEALSQLSAVDERLVRVVELRFFAGLSVEETAEVLEIDPRTVKRDWRKARALLYRNLTDPGPA